MLGSEKKSILPVLGFNQRERNDEQKWEPAPAHLKKNHPWLWYCLLVAYLHNGTCVITSCFLEIEHVALISSLIKKKWEIRHCLANRNIVSSDLVPLTASVF